MIQQTDIKVPPVNVIFKEVKSFFHGTAKRFSCRPLIVKIQISFPVFIVYQRYGKNNRANLRYLLAATVLIILFKFDSNGWLFSPCDLEIWWTTLQNNMTPLLYYFQLCASFQTHWWIQTWVTVRKCSIRVKIGDFCSAWPWNLMYDTEK